MKRRKREPYSVRATIRDLIESKCIVKYVMALDANDARAAIEKRLAYQIDAQFSVTITSVRKVKKLPNPYAAYW